MFTCLTCKCEFSLRAHSRIAKQNCTLAQRERHVPVPFPEGCRSALIWRWRTNSIINGDNHHQQPKSILIFACVEQCYIFNVLVILIKIMSLPLYSLICESESSESSFCVKLAWSNTLHPLNYHQIPALQIACDLKSFDGIREMHIH